MSKPLEQAQLMPVYGFLQKSLESQEQSNKSLQLMLNRMMNIENNVNERFVEMTEMVQEVRDSVCLTNAECSMLHSAVASKSTSLAKDRYEDEDMEFRKVVGKYRRMIWKQLKRKFDVPKYNCIRRIDFQEAIQFAGKFKPEDFI
jgi:hypothetical protein